jgi:alpha-galactosidase
MMLKKTVLPNTQNIVYFAKGLDEDTLYHFTNRELSYDIRDFGDLVNTVAPIHVKQDSRLLDFLAKRIKLPSEKEDYMAYGSLLMGAGIALKQDYTGTGYNENVRYVQDYSAKLFMMEAVDEEESGSKESTSEESTSETIKEDVTTTEAVSDEKVSEEKATDGE